jgi:hypothetical protein
MARARRPDALQLLGDLLGVRTVDIHGVGSGQRHRQHQQGGRQQSRNLHLYTSRR